MIKKGIIFLVLISGCSKSYTEVFNIALIEDTVITFPAINKNFSKAKEINIYSDTRLNKRQVTAALLKFNDILIPEHYKIDSIFLYLYYNARSGFYKENVEGHKGLPSLQVYNIKSNWNPKTIAWSDSLELAEESALAVVKMPFQDIKIELSNVLLNNEGLLVSSKGLYLKLKDENRTNYVHLTSLDGYEKQRTTKLKVYASYN